MRLTQTLHTTIGIHPKNRGFMEFTVPCPEYRVKAVIAYVAALADDVHAQKVSHKVEAVKFARKELGIGLREAVSFVEACYESQR